MPATIAVEQIGPDGDIIDGVFVTDNDAVAQIIQQRLKLFQGEWWENLSLGLPLFQSILGASGSQRQQQLIMLLILQQITSTPYVTGILSSSYSWFAAERQFFFTCAVQTLFGTVAVSNEPTPLATQAATT